MNSTSGDCVSLNARALTSRASTDGGRLIHRRQPVPRLGCRVDLDGVSVGHRNPDLFDQPQRVVEQTPAGAARRRRRRQHTRGAGGFGRALRRLTLVTCGGVVFGDGVVVAGLDDNAAVVLHRQGQVVDRVQNFLRACVIRRRPRGASIVGACHRTGAAEDPYVHRERVIDVVGQLEQPTTDRIERVGIDVHRHVSMATLSSIASV